MANEAVKQKELGNEAYKKKDFATAHQHYDKAIELDPTNMTYYSNKAAVYLEQGEYDKCIETCEKGVEIGRENRADYKLIAKVLARIGTAYLKQDKKAEALKFIEKSLSEYRDPDLLKKKNELQKEVKELEAKAYIDPAKSEEEKAKGNERFKAGDYPSAIKFYTEAIKRNPDNAALYSNRAACYHKLMEFGYAIADCDKCIEKDPKFIKGYLRKAAALLVTKETSRAQTAFEQALAIDPNNQEALDGLRSTTMEHSMNPEEKRKQAMQNPEVQAILADPAMRLILEQMGQDPKSAQEHLKNPEIMQKIMKLVDSGIVQMR